MKSIFILGVALNIIICRGPRQRWRDSLSASRRNIYRLSFRIVRTKLSLTLGSGSPLPKSKILTAFLWVLLPKSVGNDLCVVPPVFGQHSKREGDRVSSGKICFCHQKVTEINEYYFILNLHNAKSAGRQVQIDYRLPAPIK